MTNWIRTTFAAAMLAAVTHAQQLVYSNGPIETSPGFSTLQFRPPVTLSWFGHGCQLNATFDNVCADDFMLAVATDITHVELLLYQTGAGPTSTITGIGLDVLSQDPALGYAPIPGSPGLASRPVITSNAYTGVHRIQDPPSSTGPRYVMAVRVALPTPLSLQPGKYWLAFQAVGSPNLIGPFMPPVTVLNFAETGNAKTRIGAAGAWTALVSGPTNAGQGLPFRLYGTSGNAVGSITRDGNTTCTGTVQLHVNGAPVLGGFAFAELRSVTTGLPLLGYGFTNATTPFCSCSAGHEWAVVSVGRTSAVHVPADASFYGLDLRVQGAVFGAPGGCVDPQIVFTETATISIR